MGQIQYLPEVLWAYRDTPHETMENELFFLPFGVDLWTPTEAALLPLSPLEAGCVEEELTLSLSSARALDRG